jgi:hypothetical protein
MLPSYVIELIAIFALAVSASFPLAAARPRHRVVFFCPQEAPEKLLALNSAHCQHLIFRLEMAVSDEPKVPQWNKNIRPSAPETAPDDC